VIKYISSKRRRGRHGTNRKRVLIPSVVGSRGLIEELVYGSVIEDWGLSSLRVSEAIVSPPAGNPFRFQFQEYRASCLNGR